MTTDELTNKLKEYDNIDEFMEENQSEFDEGAFKSFVEDILEKKGLNKRKLSDVSGVSVPYIYNLFNGTKKCPRKDKLIMLAIGLSLNLEEANRLLKLGGVSELRSKIRRESIFIFCINKGYDIVKTDELLDEYHLPTLNKP